ncbi:hypothetical protein [Paenibacillus aceti]|uniref:Uncharacterized protein n=1 Tax=Paenibacillus aceti TaxID=1820010 RepID=A0ABQ1W5F9_9BACL|nr:hypothetical protein [Paenibacillus aceti]GGG14693.1 hypothetical protein GCM10010913_40680 [Paenibacillus aceti]
MSSFEENNHNDVKEITNRLDQVEKQLSSQNKRWKTVKKILLIIAGLYLLLIVIGIIQFISAG